MFAVEAVSMFVIIPLAKAEMREVLHRGVGTDLCERVGH